MRQVLAVLAVGAAVSISGSPADATCSEPATDASLISVALPASTLSPSGPHPTLGRTVVASGNTLRIRNTATLASVGDVILLGNVQNTPNPVQLDDGTFGVFVARQDGVVSRIDPVSATTRWSVSLRRGTCPSDSLAATPSVHLRRFATASFKARFTTDVVYVPTRYTSCAGSTTQNRVYALRATDGATLWSFNESGANSMDIVAESAFIDTVGDTLYVASERTASVTQHSLWAIDILTGTKEWSASVGRILTAPIVRGEKIYIGTRTGEIKALNKDDGTAIWSVSIGVPILTNIFPEFRNPFPNLIGVVDFLGRIHMIRDDGTTATKVWSVTLPGKSGTASATSRVAFDPQAGKVYVGANNGNIYQLSIVDGAVEATRPVSAGAIVGDAAFVFEDTDGNSSFDDVRMIAGTNTGVLAKFCTPWAAEASPTSLTATLMRRPSSPGPLGGDRIERVPTGGPNPGVCSVAADCGVAPNMCSNWACINQVCAARPSTNGTTCDDGNKDTANDRCFSGTCSGTSSCQSDFGTCLCQESDGSAYNRRLLVTESGQQTEQGGVEVSRVETTNSCFTIGSSVRSAVYVHLIDERRRPFTNADLLEFTLVPNSGTPPQWRHPVNDGPVTGLTVSLANGTLLQAARPGTYYAILAAPATGQPSERGKPIQVRVRVRKGNCIDTLATGQSILTTVRVENPGPGGVGGCNLRSDVGEAGYLRVQVLRGDTGAPAENAAVMLGYAKNAGAFYTRYDRFIDPAGPAGDASNVVFTDKDGMATFQDYGNRLNGPFIVTAGLKGSNLEFAHVTIDTLGASDVTIELPVARDPSAKHPRYTDGELGNPEKASDSQTLRLGLVSQRRPLGFYAGTDVDDMFDGEICTSVGDPIAENAFVGGEERWDKTFNARANDTIQSSYHAVDRKAVLSDGFFNLAAWAKTAVYEQIGFLDESILDDRSGTSIPLASRPPPSQIVLNVTAPPRTDVLGITLTDYSSDAKDGRGAGDVFMQAHGYLAPDDDKGSVAVPFFDLDDNSHPKPPGTNPTWNIAQAEALFLMNPPCDSTKQTPDPRCGEIPKSQRNARTSSLVRVIPFGAQCREPWDREGATLNAPAFLELVDLTYGTASGGEYDACAGGDRDIHGVCCSGALLGQSGECNNAGETQTGHYMKHTISVVESSHFDVGTCTPEMPAFTERFPYWVFYSPGEGARISVPDLPAEFTYACGGVDTSACPANTRMGLPTRVGSGADCSTSGCTGAEECVSLDGNASKVCAVRGPVGEWIVRDYEWRSELYNLGLIGSSCQTATPCDADSLPVANGSFSGAFEFGETDDCVLAQSTNVITVN